MTHAEVKTRVQALAGLGSWKLRRRMMFGCIGCCWLTIWAVLLLGLDSRVAETIASGCLLLIGTIVPAYVFGATWEDIKTKQAVLNAPPAILPKE